MGQVKYKNGSGNFVEVPYLNTTTGGTVNGNVVITGTETVNNATTLKGATTVNNTLTVKEYDFAKTKTVNGKERKAVLGYSLESAGQHPILAYYEDGTTDSLNYMHMTKDYVAFKKPIKASALKEAFPVGSLYFSSVDKSPGTFIGGQWEQLKSGVIRAAGSFSTGGSDTHTHGLSKTGFAKMDCLSTGDNNWYFYYDYLKLSSDKYYKTDYRAGLWRNSATTESFSGSTRQYAMNLGGTTNSGSTLPKYQNVYCWKRKA